MQPYQPVWESMETAPPDRDFLVRLGYGYITRARFMGSKSRALAYDSMGPAGRYDDITAVAWTEIPLYDAPIR